MSTLTPNYGLIVPDGTDTVEQVRADYATNLNIMDGIGGGGSSTLAGLSDVNLTSPTTDDALIYDGAEWVNSPLSAVAFSGDYTDLSNAPTIPTKTSDLNNDSDFVSDSAYVHTDNNFTNADATKLSGIQAGAEVNVQSDWNEADNTADDYIKNKPTIPTNTSDLNNDSGFLDSSDITVTQVQTTGAKIATIDVDGNSTDLYAPTGGGGSYTAGDGIDITSNTISVDTTFTEASTRANIASGDTFSTILGKIKKWFTDIPNLFVSKTGDSMSGNLSIDREDGTASTQGYSRLYLGNNIPAGTNKNSTGLLRLYGTGNKRIEFYDNGVLTADRTVNFQDKSGVLALTSDLEPLNKHINIKPSTTGKSTLLQYIIDVVYPMLASTYSFSADTFSDLPTNDWGYDVTVHNQGGLYVTAERQLSNGTIYVRGIDANSAWVDSWKTLATTSDIPDISTKVSKSGDTMTGSLAIQADLTVGHTGHTGEIDLYNTNGNRVSIRPSSANAIVYLPSVGGTLALKSDIDKVYSTTEKKIGKWIDNKDLYEKTVELTSLSAGGEMKKNHGINNISQVCHWQAVFLDISGGNECNNWLPNAADWSCFVQNVSRTAVGYYMGGSRLPYISKLIVTVQYTKTS